MRAMVYRWRHWFLTVSLQTDMSLRETVVVDALDELSPSFRWNYCPFVL